MTTKTLNEHIVATPGVLGGRPRIAGRRIGVEHIVTWHEQMGWSIEDIAREFDLTLADIYAALLYYYDHKDEIDTQMREGEARVEELMRHTPSLVAQKLEQMRRSPTSNGDESAPGFARNLFGRGVPKVIDRGPKGLGGLRAHLS